MNPWTRSAFLGLAVGALSACGLEGAALVGAAAGGTFVGTDKTPVDHAASAISGKDCSLLYTNNNGDWCRERVDPEQEAIRKAENRPYCYNTLGAVTCYDSPDPYSNNEVPVQ